MSHPARENILTFDNPLLCDYALLNIMITITVRFAVTYIVIKPSDSMQHSLGSSCTQGVHMAGRPFKHEMAK